MAVVGVFFAVTAAAVAAARLTPFSTAQPGAPPAPWRLTTLPKIKRHTSYSIVERDGTKVLRVEADASYANLLHPLHTDVAATPRLSWRWRVEQLSAQTDITRKQGDDLPARLCVMFDLPLSRLNVEDRVAVLIGRALFGPDLPPATICYVWDARLQEGTWLANAYTARVMMLVLRHGIAQGWEAEERDLRSDFARAFPHEAANGPAPRIAAVAVSADGDNTGAHSLAFVGDISIGE